MTPVDRYEAMDRQREPAPHIVLRQRDSGALARLDAAALITQYAVSDNRTLVVLDEDTPYEEQLHLALLQQGDVLDHVVIGGPYANGVFRADGASGDTLRFRFESEALWTLRIRAEGRRGLGGLPAGARRRTGLLAPHYLILDHADHR